MNIMEDFVCPSCKGQLRNIDCNIECLKCGHIYKKNNDIFNFIENNFYWGEIPKTIMEEVLSQAKKSGVVHAVESLIKKDYPELYSYILNGKRITPFIPLLNIDQQGTAVDLGSGYGTAAIVLSRFYGKVYAVEAVKERAEFINLIAFEKKVDNLTVVQANMHKLPFSMNTCDLIMLIGVLEWAGLGKNHKDPKVMQTNFLKELHNILKPGGALCIGIENRWSYTYFLGQVDHSGLRYTSLLPRFVSNIVCNMHHHKNKHLVFEADGYRTYTYGYWGYKELLKMCGFEEISILGCYPAYYDPKFIFTLSRDFSEYSNIMKNKNIKTKVFYSIMKNHFLRKLLSPSFVIFAKKST